jgi:hypothetical protein
MLMDSRFSVITCGKTRGCAVTVVLATLLLAGCDGLVRIRGRVVDATGIPVPEAQIQLERGADWRAFSDRVTADGCFKVGQVVAPGRYKYNVRVIAPGFAPVRGQVETLGNNYAAVVLHRVGDRAQSSIRVAIGAWPAGTRVTACDFDGDALR